MRAIAEVVSATVLDLVAQSLPLNTGEDSASTDKAKDRPRFGSFVKVDCANDSIKVIAIVNNIVTGPIDGVHRPSALGLTREQLHLEQPQIFSLLRTDIHASIIGYIKNGAGFEHLPPHPPEVHDFVYHATASDIDQVSQDFEFLRLLSTNANGPIDELLGASIREAYGARSKDDDFLLKAGEALSRLFRSDYDRLVSILRKIRPLRDV